MKIAYPTSNQKNICEFIPFCKYILIIDTKTGEKTVLPNPLFETVKKERIKKRNCGENGLHTGEILPPLLKKHGVELFIAKTLGEGMLDNLEVYGINYKLTDFNDIKKVLENL